MLHGSSSCCSLFVMVFFPKNYSPKFLEMPEKGSSGNKVTFVQWPSYWRGHEDVQAYPGAHHKGEQRLEAIKPRMKNVYNWLMNCFAFLTGDWTCKQWWSWTFTYRVWEIWNTDMVLVTLSARILKVIIPFRLVRWTTIEEGFTCSILHVVSIFSSDYRSCISASSVWSTWKARTFCKDIQGNVAGFIHRLMRSTEKITFLCLRSVGRLQCGVQSPKSVHLNLIKPSLAMSHRVLCT